MCVCVCVHGHTHSHACPCTWCSHREQYAPESIHMSVEVRGVSARTGVQAPRPPCQVLARGEVRAGLRGGQRCSSFEKGYSAPMQLSRPGPLPSTHHTCISPLFRVLRSDAPAREGYERLHQLH